MADMMQLSFRREINQQRERERSRSELHLTISAGSRISTLHRLYNLRFQDTNQSFRRSFLRIKRKGLFLVSVSLDAHLSH
jgi:hypothetical protein